MSEELLQTIPQQIGKYTYYRLGNTTLDQLQRNGIIPKKNYRRLKAKKPDGLVAYHGAIKAVVEYKQPKDLSSDKKIAKAIKQELDVAKTLCKLLIVTDGSKSFWVNALNGDRITDGKGNELRAVFHPFGIKNTTTLEYLLDDVEASIGKTNSLIRSTKLIDPSPLATRLWQTIWVATGKSPVKCLYNVVELFIFKFLSDLRILPEDIAFTRVYEKSKADPEEALDYYAKNARTKIYKLFPEGDDGTTIINGTIFATESNKPNLSQSILFQRCLDHLRLYTEEFGSLTKISKQFKTKLYASFLQQEVEALGQYFTPRKLIQSIIRLAGIDAPGFQFADKRVCDPFCGVGGFLLEILNMNESMMACYAPDSRGKIAPPFVLHGFDKGFEQDDERTIILAKANMLIYLAELLFRNPKCAVQFARVFNETFRLFRDNLGTFGHIIKVEQQKYDLVMSNPPYVTRGSSIIKEEIRKTPRTAKEYPINALGLEALSLEWIVKSLKKGGRAFLIVPDGILGRVHGKKLRDHVLQECYLEAIVSLPVRVFFANFEHTYILIFTKKHDASDVQTDPVFTYLVSNIGERLTSIAREEIEDDDLPKMESLFKVFAAVKGEATALLESTSPRCKIQPIERFRDETHWVINRWWTRSELDAIGGTESTAAASQKELNSLFKGLQSSISEYDGLLVSAESVDVDKKRTVKLGDESLFRIFIGSRVLKKDVSTDTSKIPVYSANVFEPMGYVSKTKITDFSRPSILWGIDGNFYFNLIQPHVTFATTDHCGTIQILDPFIVPEYVLYALHLRRREESFERSFRASLANMGLFRLPIPIRKDGAFDTAQQRALADRFTAIQQKQQEIEALKTRLDDQFSCYLRSAAAVI